jgi:hypothetical protein
MNDTTTKAINQVIQHGIYNIDALIGYDSNIYGCDLHNTLYNEDYFIIGTYKAKEFLNQYGTFDAIGLVQEYEQNNFGEVTTDLSDPEKVANMFAYIEGEKALNECNALQERWDTTLSDLDLERIAKELKDQLS